MEELKKEIKKILRDNIIELADVDVKNEMTLISSGFVDSFDMIKLIAIFENEFNITIAIENIDIQEFDTVDSIAKLVTKLSD